MNKYDLIIFDSTFRREEIIMKKETWMTIRSKLMSLESKISIGNKEIIIRKSS